MTGQNRSYEIPQALLYEITRGNPTFYLTRSLGLIFVRCLWLRTGAHGYGDCPGQKRLSLLSLESKMKIHKDIRSWIWSTVELELCFP